MEAVQASRRACGWGAVLMAAGLVGTLVLVQLRHGWAPRAVAGHACLTVVLTVLWWTAARTPLLAALGGLLLVQPMVLVAVLQDPASLKYLFLAIAVILLLVQAVIRGMRAQHLDGANPTGPLGERVVERRFDARGAAPMEACEQFLKDLGFSSTRFADGLVANRGRTDGRANQRWWDWGTVGQLELREGEGTVALASCAPARAQALLRPVLEAVGQGLAAVAAGTGLQEARAPFDRAMGPVDAEFGQRRRWRFYVHGALNVVLMLSLGVIAWALWVILRR